VAIDLALDCGAPIDALDDWGVSARALALAAGHADAAARLAQRGAPLDLSAALATGDLHAAAKHAAVDLRAGTAARLVHFTTRHAGAEATRWLLDRGADPDVLAAELRGDSLFRLTALHGAATRGDVETARVLLDRGADPDRAAIGGTAHTPLHAAAAANAAPVAALLLARGADRGRRDAHHDATPLEWARFFGHAQVAAAIEDAP
jgi:ankyrin repeat protein